MSTLNGFGKLKPFIRPGPWDLLPVGLWIYQEMTEWAEDELGMTHHHGAPPPFDHVTVASGHWRRDPDHPFWVRFEGKDRVPKKASLAASERVGRRPSSAHGRRKRTSVSTRGKCPKGHYWSYKHKKCVRSKFK